MKGGPTPAEGRAPAPTGGWLFRVAYISQRGETFSKLYRQQAAAERFARRVLDHGGRPRLHRVRIDGWLFRVAYVDKSMRTRQRFFRLERHARAWAVDIVQAGGQPRLRKVRVRGWEEFAGWFD